MGQIRNALQELNCIRLYITMLNIINRNLIFSWKLLCIGICIVTGYAAIAHFGEYPIFGVMYYVMCLDSSMVYTVLYGNAYRIPALFQEIKVLLKFRGQQITNHGNRRLLVRRVVSLPAVGIRVGQFHMLERASVPVFLNYVLTNVVSMLVVYK